MTDKMTLGEFEQILINKTSLCGSPGYNRGLLDAVAQIKKHRDALEAGIQTPLRFKLFDLPNGGKAWCEIDIDGNRIDHHYEGYYGGLGYGFGSLESCIKYGTIRGLPVEILEDKDYDQEDND